MKITLSGKDSKNKTLNIVIPVLPERIGYKTSGRFQEYDIINLGKVKMPSGKELSYVSWESFLPGAILKNEPYVVKYTAPKTLHNQLDYWRKNGQKLKLTITTTPISLYVYIDSYEAVFEGPNGNITYSIEFSGAVDISVSTVKKKQNKTTGTARTSKKSNAKKHTVKKYQTLWKIGKIYYGKSSMANCNKIYNANKTVIENAAKKHGKKSSNKGHWIYPGTVLKIP